VTFCVISFFIYLVKLMILIWTICI